MDKEYTQARLADELGTITQALQIINARIKRIEAEQKVIRELIEKWIQQKEK